MAKRTSSRKVLIIEDDEHEEDPDDRNPFSFKEFIRSKNQSSVCGGDVDEQEGNQELKKTGSESVLVGEEECAPNLPRPFHTDSAPFHTDPAPFLSDHTPVCTDSASFHTDSVRFQQSSVQEGTEWGASPRAHDLSVTLDGTCPPPPRVPAESGRDAAVPSQREAERGPAPRDRAPDAPVGGVSCQTRPGRAVTASSDQQLREENARLRNHVKELLQKSKADAQRIRELEEQLQKQTEKEEREAQALETMVQSVEQNLQKMTKRAVKAETNSSKLQKELLQLQDQLEAHRSENERLRAEETTASNTMKQNAQVASEYLSKAASNAQTSIRQLLSEAETLSLVSKMLCSIDKISQVHAADC